MKGNWKQYLEIASWVAAIIGVPLAIYAAFKPEARPPKETAPVFAMQQAGLASAASTSAAPNIPPPLPPPNVFNGVFHQVMLEERPLGLHGITVRNNAPGTADSKLIVSIEEVTPTCTPEGANGHVRARLKGSIDFEDGTHDDYIMRDFVKNPENYKSPDREGPVIGPRIPRRITLAIEGECGPERHDPLYPGEQPT